jgi:hypothetical protein
LPSKEAASKSSASKTKGAVFIITAALHYITVTLHMTVTLRVTLSIL